MEGIIHEGWLVKSPPEKKIHGPWFVKFFQAKWRRRYFVLHKPEGSLPGSYALDYYNDQTLKRFIGTIDLDQCQEVLSALNSEQYNYLFAIVSKHKSKTRTYYLAAESDADMVKWVKCLCQVCGLTKDDLAEEAPVQVSPQHTSHPQLAQAASNHSLVGHGPQPSTTQGYTPDPVSLTHTSPSRPQPPLTQTVSHHPNRGQSSSPTQPPAVSQSKSTEYIPISECVSGKDNNNTKPLLDKVPPAPRSENVLPRSASSSSIPDEIAPLPPKTPKEEPLSPNSTYDRPKYPYYNPDDQEANFYKVPNPSQYPAIHQYPKSPKAIPVDDIDSNPDFYDSPGQPRPVSSELYNVPRSLKTVTQTLSVSTPPPKKTVHQKISQPNLPSQQSNNDFYDTPRPRKDGVSQPETLPEIEGVMDDTYDIPPPRLSPRTHTSDKPARPIRNEPAKRNSGSSNSSRSSQKNDSAYSSEETGDRHSKPTAGSADDFHVNLAIPRDLYDVPKSQSHSASNMLEQVPPPPVMPPRSAKPKTSASSSYMNLPDNTVSASTWNSQPNVTMDDTYDVPRSRDHPGDVFVTSPPPCLGEKENRDYMNAPNLGPESYIPMFSNTRQDGGGEMYAEAYADMVGDRRLPHSQLAPNRPPRTESTYATHPSNIPVNQQPIRLQPAPAQRLNKSPKTTAYKPYPEEYVIKPSKRTESFKRRIDSRSSGDVPLPLRRGTSDESSSDAESDDNSSSTASMEAVHHTQVSSMPRVPREYPPNNLRRAPGLDSTPPPPMSIRMNKNKIEYLDLRDNNDNNPYLEAPPLHKKVLNYVPSPPRREKHEKELQYLELGDSSEPEHSPNLPHTRSPPANTGGLDNKTEYREIDFVRTQALSDTIRKVEHDRKSSETDKP